MEVKRRKLKKIANKYLKKGDKIYNKYKEEYKENLFPHIYSHLVSNINVNMYSLAKKDRIPTKETRMDFSRELTALKTYFRLIENHENFRKSEFTYDKLNMPFNKSHDFFEDFRGKMSAERKYILKVKDFLEGKSK